MTRTMPTVHTETATITVQEGTLRVLGRDARAYAATGTRPATTPLDVAGCGCGCGDAATSRPQLSFRHCDVPSALLTFELPALARRTARTKAGRLVGITLLPYCSTCRSSRRGCVRVDRLTIEEVDGTNILTPACSLHTTGPSLDSDTVEAALGVPVVWADGRHPLALAALADWAARYPLPPFPRGLRFLDADLEPGGLAHVFPEHVRQDDDGRLWLRSRTRLIQPMPGHDLPITRDDAGHIAIHLAGVTLARPLRRRVDGDGFTVLANAHGTPAIEPRTIGA